MSVMLMPSTLIPYYACAASEGTQEIPMHSIQSPHHSPWPALSVDSAAALTPINDVVRRSSSERQAKVRNFLKGKARSNGSDGTSTKGGKQIKCKWKKEVAHAKEEMGNQKQDETKWH